MTISYHSHCYHSHSRNYYLLLRLLFLPLYSNPIILPPPSSKICHSSQAYLVISCLLKTFLWLFILLAENTKEFTTAYKTLNDWVLINVPPLTCNSINLSWPAQTLLRFFLHARWFSMKDIWSCCSLRL